MKRIISLVLVLCMMTGLTACGGGTEPAGEVSETPAATEVAETETPTTESDSSEDPYEGLSVEAQNKLAAWDAQAKHEAMYAQLDQLIQDVKDEYYALNADRATRDEVTMKYNEFTDEYVFSERTVYAEAEQFASWPAGNMIPTGGTYYVNWYEPTAVLDNATSAEIFKFPNVDSYDAYVDDGVLKVIIYPVERYHVYYTADRLDGYLVYDNSYIFYYEPAEDIMYANLGTNYRSSDFVYIGSTDMSEEEICANFEVPQEFLDKLEVQAQEAAADQALVDEYWSQYIYPSEDFDTISAQIINEARDVYNEVFQFPYYIGEDFDDNGNIVDVYANSLDEIVSYLYRGETFDTRADVAISGIINRIEDNDYFDYNTVLYKVVKDLYDSTFVQCTYSSFTDDSFVDTLNDKLIEISKRIISATKIDSDIRNTIYIM